MVKLIQFGSGEMTQGDGWFEMHQEVENYPDGAFKVNIEMPIMWRMCPQSSALNRLEDQLAKEEGQLTPLTNRGVGRETWW